MTRVDDELVIKLSRVWMATPALTHPRIESASWANPRFVVGSRRENEFGKKTKVSMFFSFAAGSRDHDWRTRARQGTCAVKEKWKWPDEKISFSRRTYYLRVNPLRIRSQLPRTMC